MDAVFTSFTDEASMPSRPQTYVEKTYDRRYILDYGAPRHDYWVCAHPNGVCVVGVCATHILFDEVYSGSVQVPQDIQIAFPQVQGQDLLSVKSNGKKMSKRDGTWVKRDTVVCSITAGHDQDKDQPNVFECLAGIEGKILQVERENSSQYIDRRTAWHQKMPLNVDQHGRGGQILNWNAQFIDRPSIKYTPVDPPSAVIMAQARQEPRPVLALRTDPKDWCSKSRDKLRLSLRLVNSQVRGKYAELIGHDGGRYVGETVGGKQHGRGQYYAPATGSGTNFILQYDGQWLQGQRHGYGTEYDSSGEIYIGMFHNGSRQGFGQLQYACGDVYEGEWRGGVHHGRGTCVFANGDVFEGSFIKGCRQGLGILLRPSKGLAHVWEFIKGIPQSGTVLEINGDKNPPRAKIVHDMLERHNRRARIVGDTQAPTVPVRLPPIDLVQPNAVFHTQAVKIRSAQGQLSSQSCILPTAALTAPQLERLRHAFELLCEGSGKEAGVKAHQLPEIMVMAGMDLSAPDTRNALAELGQALKANQDRRLLFENFLRIVDHYISDVRT